MKLIPLPQNKNAFVSDWIYEYVKSIGPWFWEDLVTRVRIYRVFTEPDGTQRQITLASTIKGPAPKGFVWDHVNRNGFDNTDENLRLATYSQNGVNRNILRTNTSGYTGASWHSQHEAWVAYTTKDGKRLTFCEYTTVEEAAYARDYAVQKVHGKFATLNFPDAIPLPQEKILEIQHKVDIRLSGKGGKSNRLVYSNNTSGCPGVIYFVHNKKWQVLITNEEKERTFVGYYEIREHAIYAYIYGYTKLRGYAPNIEVQLNLSAEVKLSIEARVSRYISKKPSDIDVFGDLVNPTETEAPQGDSASLGSPTKSEAVSETMGGFDDLLN